MGRSEAGLTAACTDLINCMMAVKWWLVTCLVAAMVLVTSATPAESKEAGEYLASDIQEVENIRQQREANKGKANKGKAKRKANKGKAKRKANKGKANKGKAKRKANKG